MFVTLGHITLEHVTLRHVTIRMSPCDKSYQEVTPLNTVLKLINQFIFFIYVAYQIYKTNTQTKML